MFTKLISTAILAIIVLGQGAVSVFVPQNLPCGAETHFVPKASSAVSPAQYPLSVPPESPDTARVENTGNGNVRTLPSQAHNWYLCIAASSDLSHRDSAGIKKGRYTASLHIHAMFTKLLSAVFLAILVVAQGAVAQQACGEPIRPALQASFVAAQDQFRSTTQSPHSAQLARVPGKLTETSSFNWVFALLDRYRYTSPEREGSYL
ncbi:hypothetical protein C8R44DRAFT_878931 [Mycena epipterygia]|nr:hypothetical protein C8R44DRAFT_878931 [Mycena epipterygia]